jgi:BirA family biotin operon repressor/biotin-[acetyl-CoA-carboxylase] ligase
MTMPDKEKIIPLLKTAYMGREIYCFDSIPSTNEYLKSHINELKNGTAALADEQTKGYGRKGNKWESPKGGSLSMSVMIKPVDVLSSPSITLACGLAVVRALNTLYGGGFRIKWPNDIVYKDKKICGILCEAKIDKPCCSVICGIGINLTQSDEQFKACGLDYAASIKTVTGKTPVAEELAAAILNEFETVFDDFIKNGFKDYYDEYRGLCVTLGSEIKVITKDGEIYGSAVDISKRGQLIVKTADNLITIEAGEVSVRGIMGYI